MAATKYIINNIAVRIRIRSDPDGCYNRVGADSYAPVGAFLCFLPPLFRFLLAGASEDGCPGLASVRDGGDACRRLDLQGLSAGAAHGNQGEINPLLGRTPLA